MKNCLAIAILLLMPSISSAQLSAYHDRALSPQSVLGIPSPVMAPIAYGQVRVCTGNVLNSGSPCTPIASIFDGSGNALAVSGGNFGQVFTDVTGQFTFQCTAGLYTIQVAASASNTPQLNYLIGCPNTGAGSSGVTGTGLAVLQNSPTITGSPLITGNLISCRLENVRFVDPTNVCGWAGADVGAWINSAVADLPTITVAAVAFKYGTIQLAPAGSFPITQNTA